MNSAKLPLCRVLAEVNRYAVGTPYRRGGYGYLRQTIHGWNSAAKGIPFIVLTDLDTAECPARLITDWLHVDEHPNLLFRIAVREVESWLLADPTNLSAFLNLRTMPVPANTDAIERFVGKPPAVCSTDAADPFRSGSSWCNRCYRRK
jgi:hypothetical protein